MDGQFRGKGCARGLRVDLPALQDVSVCLPPVAISDVLDIWTARSLRAGEGFPVLDLHL